MTDDESLKYKMSFHSSRSLNFQIEDVKNLSLYIKNVSANIKNIDYQLNKRRNNKSFMNSNEIINETENDDEARPPSNIVNPFSRNMLLKRYSTVLFSTSYTKEKMVNQSLLNKTSITEDSGREAKEMMKNLAQLSVEKETLPTTRLNISNCNNSKEVIEDKKSIYRLNQQSLSKFPSKTKTLPLTKRADYHRLINSQKISKHQSKTIFEDYNSNKKNAIPKSQRVKSQMTSVPIQDSDRRIKQPSATQPFCLTIPSVSPNKKKNLVMHSSFNKPIQTLAKFKYASNITEGNQPKQFQAKLPQPRKPQITKKDTLQDMYKIKNTLNDKDFAEMYLLYSEVLINSTQKSNSESTNNHLDYFNEMKTSYSIRNSDTYKITPFSNAYLKDKTNIAILRIQRHWRQWKISRLIACQAKTKSELIKSAKMYFYMEMLKKDKDFREMLTYITKANECYAKCLKNKQFEKAKNMILNDFIVENSKGELNELSNIINLHLQLNKKPSQPLKSNKKIIKR